MNLTIPKKINLNGFSRKGLLNLVRQMSRYGVGLLFLVALLGISYLWYISVYAYDWTEEQKNQYRSEYAGETTFREEKFNRTVEVLEERIRLHRAVPTVKRDIFVGVPL